jgi:periplasmic divalent cation tolerance protein
MTQIDDEPDGREALIVFVTCPQDAADALAAGLVESGTAACVNLLPAIRSVYRWRGTIERSDESLLLIKTDARHYAALQDAVRERHPYELPEIVAVNIAQGLPEYLKWVSESLNS